MITKLFWWILVLAYLALTVWGTYAWKGRDVATYVAFACLGGVMGYLLHGPIGGDHGR